MSPVKDYPETHTAVSFCSTSATSLCPLPLAISAAFTPSLIIH